MSALIPAPQSTSPASRGPKPPSSYPPPYRSTDRATDRSTGGGTCRTGRGADRIAGRIAGRSQTVDVVRAVCVLVVVMLHALMVGVERSPDGGLSTRVALAGTAWFAPASWLIQVMPLFFIVGGFASAQHWRRVRSRGGTAAEYVQSRVRRLALPAAAMILAVGAALALADGLGVDTALLAEARLRMAQPLWFLAVYMGVTAMVPIMMRPHEVRPVAMLLGLGSGIVIVDAVRLTTELPAVGYANLIFVWLFMQQLGFLLSDGRVEAWSSGRVGAGLASGGLHVGGKRAWGIRTGGVPRGLLLCVFALGLLVIAVTRGPYSADMLVNLNPPTAALALLGVAQFFALCVVKPAMDRWWDAAARARSIARAGSAVSAGSMTLYLWHMPVVLTLAAAIWAVDLPLPAPHSGAWWLTRLPWLVALALALGGAYAVRKALTRLWQTAASRATDWRGSGCGASAWRTTTWWESPSRGRSPHEGTGAGQSVLFVVAAVVGVLIVLFCLGDIVPSTLVSSALLTLSVWPVWGHRMRRADPSSAA